MLIKPLFCLFVLIACVLQMTVPFAALAQTDRRLERETKSPPAEKRVALVIGNGNYRNASVLPNPVNDAVDMAAALKELGFEVISGTNQTKPQMENLIRQFGTRLADTKAVGLFFYAGHGISKGGTNYLVPVEADIQAEDEVEYGSVSIDFLLGKMESAKNGFNVVILDACRNNPFARKWRNYREIGDKGGLARIDAPTGTLIAYATKPGDVASDGTGRNGLYTGALLKQMRVKNVDITKMFQRVRADVIDQSGGNQVPFDESSLVGDFYFVRDQLPPTNTDPVIEAKTEAAQERESWDLVKNSSDAEDLRLYLKEFPTGTNARKARIRLEELVWSSAKASSDKSRVQAYLTEFPNGANAAAGRIRLRQLESAAATTPATPTNTGAVTPGTVRKSPAGIELVWVPRGEFIMGSTEAEIDEALFECKKINKDCKREWFIPESPKRKVTIKEGFWMGRYEVTQGEWQSVMGDNPSRFSECGARCPVEQVSWDDIQVFLMRLNSKDSGFEYSLPSEAQWEYAARAGTTTAFAFGNSLSATQANFDGNYPYGTGAKGAYIGKTVTAGSYRPNAWGLYDMHGNVWEWAEDIYNENRYRGLPADGSAKLRVRGSSSHVLRGGSWFDSALNTRSAYRNRNVSSERNYFFGFRVLARSK